MGLSKLTGWIGAGTLALGLMVGATSPAQAAPSELQIDINAFRGTFLGDGPFDANATGIIQFTEGATGHLAGVEIDGSTAPGFDASLFRHLNGQINLVNGVVQSGWIEVRAYNNDTDLQIVDYYADILDGLVSDDFVSTSFDFVIGGNTLGGFTDSQFAGVDVSAWEGENYLGSFLQFSFDPTLVEPGVYVDDDTDLDLTVVVPTPAAALAGLPLLGVLGIGYAVRRRRLSATV